MFTFLINCIIMKHYITADVHGFYTEFHKALDEAGYFTDPEPHKVIILAEYRR